MAFMHRFLPSTADIINGRLTGNIASHYRDTNGHFMAFSVIELYTDGRLVHIHAGQKLHADGLS